MTVAIDRRLQQLEVNLRYKLKGFLDGSFQGMWGDEGMVPSGARPYQPGDKLARIHRAATAKTGRLHVYTSEPERAAIAVGVVDQSPSMYFGTAEIRKSDIARIVAYGLSRYFSQDGNFFSSVSAGEEIVSRPARSSRTVPSLLYSHLGQTQPPDGTQVWLRDGLKKALAMHRKAEYAVVVSDFQSTDWEEALANLCLRRASIAIQPLDPWELELPDMGEINMVDPVSGEQRTLVLSGRRGGQIRKEYAERAQARQESIADSIQAAHADHLVLRTDEDWISKLIQHFRQRRYQHRR